MELDTDVDFDEIEIQLKNVKHTTTPEMVSSNLEVLSKIYDWDTVPIDDMVALETLADELNETDIPTKSNNQWYSSNENWWFDDDNEKDFLDDDDVKPAPIHKPMEHEDLKDMILAMDDELKNLRADIHAMREKMSTNQKEVIGLLRGLYDSMNEYEFNKL
jgi:hypothetical protein